MVTEIGQKHSFYLILKTKVHSPFRTLLYIESLDHGKAAVKSEVESLSKWMKMMWGYSDTYSEK